MEIQYFNECIIQLRNLPEINQDVITVIETAGTNGLFKASFSNLNDVTLDLIAAWSPFKIHPQVRTPPKDIGYIISWYGIQDTPSEYFTDS